MARSTPRIGAVALLLCAASLHAAAQEPAAPPAAVAPPAEAAAATPAPPETPPAAPAPAPAPPRITFDLPLAQEKGGGIVSGSAEGLEFVRDDRALLTGAVEAKYQDLALKAQRVEVDLATRVLTAEGEVILDQGPRRMTGDTLTFDLTTKTGTLTNAAAHVTPDYFFEGTEIAKVGEDSYTVVDGTFTSCEGDKPAWSFHLGRARVDVGGYARVHHASMWLRKLPIFYTPYLLWPAKPDRTSGLLVPNFGYSENRGAYLGLAYFQTLGRSVDTTFHVDTYGEGFLGLGNELRYRPTEGTRGEFRFYAVRDDDALPTEDEWRWKVELDHRTEDLPWGMRGAATVRRTSDFDFFRDFERDFDRASRRFEESSGFVSGNWGPHLLTAQVTDSQRFDAGQESSTDRRLPEVEYQLRSTKLGRTPLVLQMNSSVALLSVDRSATYQADYGRFDLAPELTLPVSPADWLNLSLTGGGRVTWYSDSLDAARTGFSGEALTRTLATARAQVVGPSFARLFTTGSHKFLHVVEPRFVYGYSSDFEDQGLVPGFDEVDGAAGGNSVGRVSLIQRLKAKPTAGAGASGIEVATFELSRSYSFDDERFLESGGGERSTSGPIEAVLRVNPSRKLFVSANANYSGLFSRLLSTALSAGVTLPRANFDLRWNTAYAGFDGRTLNDQVRFSTGLAVVPNRLVLRGSLDYDFERSLLQEQRYFIDYTAQCYAIHAEVRFFQTGKLATDLQETDYRLSFSLKNVGTFLDLTGRYE